MTRRFWLRCLPLMMVFSLVAPTGAFAADAGKQIEQEYGVVGYDSSEGRRLNDQLDRVVERIVPAVNAQRSKEFQLRSAKILGGRSDKHNRVVNAFALPDGRIYVTLGLLRALEDSRRPDDELAFVVGHEVTHVVERHSQHQQNKAVGAGVLAILLGAATKNQTLGTLGQYGAAAYVSSFSRKDEYRADKGGLLAMHRAGYDLDAAISMLNRLKAKGEDQNRLITGWFGSHPLTGNRVDKIEQMIDDIRSGRDPDADGDRDRRRNRD
jgi:predicted Zn-dependent protease